MMTGEALAGNGKHYGPLHASNSYLRRRFSQVPLIRRKSLFMLPSVHELQYYGVREYCLRFFSLLTLS